MGVAVLIQRENKLLLSRRLNTPEENHWQCAGGYLHFGEDIFQCAQRCAQATGLQISQLSSGPVTNNIFGGQNLHTVTLYVLAGKCEGNETDGWQWFDWQQLPQPLFLPVQLLVTQSRDWLTWIFHQNDLIPGRKTQKPRRGDSEKMKKNSVSRY